MASVISYFSEMGIDFHALWKSVLLLLAGTLGLSILSRFVFGKRSMLNRAISSSIGILFIYALTLVLMSAGARFSRLTTPLPFVTVSGNSLYLFSFAGASYTAVCGEVLSMIILAFLVNQADTWLPQGKTPLAWIFFRCLTVIVGYVIHLVATGLLSAYLPTGIITYAPVILLGLLLLMLLTGTLKLLVGALLSTVNPIIGGLYTFFFASAIGKQITRAVLTTALLTALVTGLQYIGISVISFAGSALIAYIPVLILLIALWYLVLQSF